MDNVDISCLNQKKYENDKIRELEHVPRKKLEEVIEQTVKEQNDKKNAVSQVSDIIRRSLKNEISKEMPGSKIEEN